MPVYRKRGTKDRWRVKIWNRGRWLERIVRGSKADAEAFEARERVRLETISRVDVRTVPSFAAFCVERYAPHAETHLRASTWKVRCYQLETLIEHFRALKLTAITVDDVDAFKKKRIAHGRRPRSINNELGVLQAVIAHARKIGVPVGQFPVERLPVVGHGRVKFWTVAEMDALFESISLHSPELDDVVLTIANTGLRKGEALALEWSWIDFARKMIRIEPNEEWQPKDNEPREIPIGRALLPMLRRRWRERASDRWVFPSSEGERYACWPKLQFDRARKLASHARSCALLEPKPKGGRLPGGDGKKAPPPPSCSCGARGLRGGPHTLRHTYATHFLQKKPDLHLLAKILGHSTERTTRIYAHLLPSHLEQGRDAVELLPNRGRGRGRGSRRDA